MKVIYHKGRIAVTELFENTAGQERVINEFQSALDLAKASLTASNINKEIPKNFKGRVTLEINVLLFDDKGEPGPRYKDHVIK